MTPQLRVFLGWVLPGLGSRNLDFGASSFPKHVCQRKYKERTVSAETSLARTSLPHKLRVPQVERGTR